MGAVVVVIAAAKVGEKGSEGVPAPDAWAEEVVVKEGSGTEEEEGWND